MTGLLFKPRTVATLRRVVGSALAHTYRVASLDTEAGDDQAEWGAPSAPLPCFYVATQRELGPDARGQVVLDSPRLLVAHDDPLAAGQQVSDVRDGDGVLLLDAAEVESVEPTAPNGTVLKLARLRAVRGG